MPTPTIVKCPHLPFCIWRLCSLLAACWAGSMDVDAQLTQHININHGLCTNTLTDLTFDRAGNLWIGSYGGLMKYSGGDIHCFNQIGNGPYDLSGPEMHSVTEDPCGYIWAGTTAGLNKIHPLTYEVTQYPIRSPFSGQAFVGYIYSVFADSRDFIWFSTDVGVFRFDAISETYQMISGRQDSLGIPGKLVSYNGYAETQEGIWFSTDAGMVFYSFRTGLFHHRDHHPGDQVIFRLKAKHGNLHSDVCLDHAGRLWWVWDHYYLAMFDPATNHLDTIRFAKPPGVWHCCYSVAVDTYGQVWLGQRHGGVSVYHPDTRTFDILPNTGVNRMVHSDYIYSIEEGPGGRVFIAHDQGLDMIDLYDTSIRELRLSGRDDFLVLKHESGDISLDHHTGLVYAPFMRKGFFTYNSEQDSIHFYPAPSDHSGTYFSLFFHQGRRYTDGGGNLWPLDHNNEVVSDQPLLPESVEQYQGGIVWCHAVDSGEWILKKSSGRILWIRPDTTIVMRGAGFKPNLDLSADSTILTYINSQLDLVRLELSTRRMDTIPLQSMLSGMDFSFANPRHILDDGPSIWMTGQNGLLRYTLDSKRLEAYSMKDGLAHSFTFSLVLDEEGLLWVGSLGGIDRYDPAKNRFTTIYTLADNTYMDAFGSALRLNNGTLVFHFGNKIIRILPRGIAARQTWDRHIQFHEVRINDLPVDWTKEDLLQNLSSRQNRISVRFDIRDFDAAEFFFYRYRLNEGDWTDHGKRHEIRFDGLASGRYQLDIQGQSESTAALTPVTSLYFRIRPPFWKTWWFLSLLGAVIGSVIFSYIRFRYRQLQRRSEIEIQMAQLKSTALKAQMNPHFVFNSLNAIQECIVTGQVDEAYTYLSQFARLLRLVLEHSDQREVTLERELEVLSIYVSLEKLRFRNELEYIVDIDPGLDEEEIRIPPMLIQPHLENAIWHGLRHKQGDRRLQMTLEEMPLGYLRVSIEDNGIGREASRQLNETQRSRLSHASRGTLLSRERMELLRTLHPETDLQIHDLRDDRQQASGTRVVLTIPILRPGVSDNPTPS